MQQKSKDSTGRRGTVIQNAVLNFLNNRKKDIRVTKIWVGENSFLIWQEEKKDINVDTGKENKGFQDRKEKQIVWL